MPIVDGLRLDCPKCEKEGFYAREIIEGESPIICPNPECGLDLTALRPMFKRHLAEAVRDAEAFNRRACLMKEEAFRIMKALKGEDVTVH